ncbi:putative uncharacterized protein [Firmicutes bacterium CAG:884]|nr:DUF87 domain-containing protein [Bacillota bacterium]CCY94202.1 putative uncharacterized protein [Firmicutes bacterium CAG:884]
MLGTIIAVEENMVYVKLNPQVTNIGNIANSFVVFESSASNIVGEVINVKENILHINLVGQIKDNVFVTGISKKPSLDSAVKVISKEKIPFIIGMPTYKENRDLLLGTSPIYDNVQIGVNVNDFFSKHFAIIGSTGSGKSCGVARIFQNLFSKKMSVPYKASIFLFDAYGEYHNAFKDINKINPNINFKAYTTNIKGDTEIMRIPLWFLGVDDIALLLNAEKANQLTIIEKALKYVTIFGREETSVIKYKNDIIARALLDILASGNSPAQIRDQVFSVLSYYNTSELNLETPVVQPGYTRPLKQCFLIDATGKIRDMELVTNIMNGYLLEEYSLELPDGSFKYTLKDLKDAFEFALISEGVLKSQKIYDDLNILKVRLHTLLNSDNHIYFDYPEYITKEKYIRNLMTAPNGRKAQIINFNINYIDDRLAKTITKIYAKLLFDYSKNMEQKASFPFHIVLEEAHRYVQNDNDIYLLGYNIFDRITKEGRKYGVLLGLITQRPSELSETAISQCSNFLIFKVQHPKDVGYIKEMVPNITEEEIKKIKMLPPGMCMAFGSGFKLPVLVKFAMPNPEPNSRSANITESWFVDVGGK